MIITADASSSGQCTGDAAVIIDMARALATAVGDPEPRLTVEDLVRDGSGSGRWFDCFVAEADGALVGYALACKAYEAHTGDCGSAIFTFGQTRAGMEPVELWWPRSRATQPSLDVTRSIGSFGD